MSQSDERDEQLLNGYLDDALESEQRAGVEKLLRDQPDLMARLNDMRVIRDSLKQVSRRDAHFKLDAGFPDRVMQAAVTRAREEGLAEDHPLLKVAEQPMGDRVAKSASDSPSWRRVAGLMVGLAASLGLAMFIANRSEPETPVAINLDATNLDATERPEPTAPPSALALAKPEVAEETPASIEPAVTEPVSPSPESAVASAMPQPESMQPKSLEPVMAPRAITPPADTAAPMVAISRDNDASGLAAVLVLDIRQTKEGRENRAVAKALREATISSLDRQPITQAIAGSATEAVGVSVDEAVSLMYLEASAKSLDQFYLNLLADNEGIESVAMTLSMNAPVLQTVEDARLDPTTVQHSGEGSAVELFSEDGSVENLVDQIDELKFAKFSRDTAAMMSQSNGPDITAKILVVIR